MTVLKPRAFPTTVSPIPVLPAVPSTMVPPRFSVPFFNGVLDDEQGGAVFDGLTGVQKFSFAKDRAAGFFRSPLELDQGRTADCSGDPVDNGHEINLPFEAWLQPRYGGRAPQRNPPGRHVTREQMPPGGILRLILSGRLPIYVPPP